MASIILAALTAVALDFSLHGIQKWLVGPVVAGGAIFWLLLC